MKTEPIMYALIENASEFRGSLDDKYVPHTAIICRHSSGKPRSSSSDYDKLSHTSTSEPSSFFLIASIGTPSSLESISITLGVQKPP